jgi:MYXO-CTERM domain-containing protein
MNPLGRIPRRLNQLERRIGIAFAAFGATCFFQLSARKSMQFQLEKHPMRRICLALIATLLTLSLSGIWSSASAAPITFFGEDLAPNLNPANLTNANAAQASFLANLISPQVETFESFNLNAAPPYNINFGASTATITGSGVVVLNNANGNVVGRFTISGDRYLDSNASLLLTFNTPQAAFGFFGTDIGDFSGQLTISIDGGTPIPVPHTVNGPNGTGLFFGIIDTASPFTTVQFGTTTGADFFGFDDFTIATPNQVQPPTVPEPASLAVWGLVSAAGLAAWRRKRKTPAA